MRRRLGDGSLEACGNPVKDAMATKVFEDCRDVAAVVYAPASEPREAVEACAERFAAFLRTFAGARMAGGLVLEP